MMQMEDKELKCFREKLYDVQIPVDGDIWASIEGSLRRKRMRRIFYYASSVAAVVLVALLLVLPSSSQQELLPNAVAEVSVSEIPYSEIPYVTGDLLEPVLPEKVGEIKSGADAIAQRSGGFEVNNNIVEVSDGVAGESSVDGSVGQEAVVHEASEGPVAVKDLQDQNTEKGQDHFWAQEEKIDDSRVAFALMTGVMPGSSASVMNSSIRASQSGIGSNNGNEVVEQISDTKYSLPLNLGVQVQFPVGDNLALGVGVNYTMISSRYDCLINKKKHSIKQSLHYVGIPVNIYGIVVERNNFSFYVNAGATAEKGIRAVYTLESYTGKERMSNPIDGIQFSVNAGLGVEYKFSNPAGIYFEPNMVYFFNSNVPRSIRTDQPLQVKGELGVRFHF